MTANDQSQGRDRNAHLFSDYQPFKTGQVLQKKAKIPQIREACGLILVTGFILATRGT
jgi:hypothetical protein